MFPLEFAPIAANFPVTCLCPDNVKLSTFSSGLRPRQLIGDEWVMGDESDDSDDVSITVRGNYDCIWLPGQCGHYPLMMIGLDNFLLRILEPISFVFSYSDSDITLRSLCLDSAPSVTAQSSELA